MKVISPLVECFHLDPAYALLSIQNIMTALQVFHILDLHGTKSLNDVIFDCYMKQMTDLRTSDVDVVFRLLDADQSGSIEFDEFYLLFCVMVACKDQYEKEFIYRHSNSIFRLIDADDSGQVSGHEFANMGILFNFDKRSVMSIFNEFDISGDKNLDFSEFRLFTMACIDEQRISDAHGKVAAFREYNHRLINNLTSDLKRYVKSRHLPPPLEIEATIESTRRPYMIRYHYRGNLVRRISDGFFKVKEWFLNLLKLLTLVNWFKKPCKKSESKVRSSENSLYEGARPNTCKCCCNHLNCCRRRVYATNGIEENHDKNDNSFAPQDLSPKQLSLKMQDSNTKDCVGSG